MKYALLLSALALPACESARDCLENVPPDLRADTVRYVLDKSLLARSYFTQDEVALGLGAGTPPERLAPEREALVVPRAIGLTECVRDRTRP